MANTLSRELVRAADRVVYRNWVDEGCLRHSIGARAVYLALAPVSLVTSAADLVFGSILAAKGCIHLGCNEFYVEQSLNQLYSARKIFTRPYMNLVKFVNPSIRFKLDDDDNDRISYKGNGFFSFHLVSLFNKCGIDQYFRNLDNFFARNISTRLCSGLMVVALIIARTADGIISVPTCAVSILTAGKFQALNNLAYRTSQAFGGVFYDITVCIFCVINPWNDQAHWNTGASQEPEVVTDETSRPPNTTMLGPRSSASNS